MLARIKNALLELYYSIIGPQLRTPHGFLGRWIMGPILKSINTRISNKTLVAMNIGPDQNVIDLGCGTGLAYEALKTTGHRTEFTGLDLSEVMINSCRRQFRKDVLAGKLKLVQANLEKIPLDSESYDHALTVNTIYFWDNPDLVMAEIRRILKPGASLAISFRSAEKMAQHPLEGNGFNSWSVYDVRYLMEKHGFFDLTHYEWDRDKFLDIHIVVGTKA